MSRSWLGLGSLWVFFEFLPFSLSLVVVVDGSFLEPFVEIVFPVANHAVRDSNERWAAASGASVSEEVS